MRDQSQLEGATAVLPLKVLWNVFVARGLGGGRVAPGADVLAQMQQVSTLPVCKQTLSVYENRLPTAVDVPQNWNADSELKLEATHLY